MEMNRVEFFDRRSGRTVIAERVDGVTEYWEKEYGGVKWYEFKATLDIEEQADALFHEYSTHAIPAAA